MKLKLEALILSTLIFTGCANFDYNPEERNIEWGYKTADYEIVVQPVVKDGYGVRIIYEF